MLNSDMNKTPLIPGLKIIIFYHIQLATPFKFKCRVEFRSLCKMNREKPTEKKKRGYFHHQWTLKLLGIYIQNMDNWVQSEGCSKRYNQSDELSALPRAQPLGMLGTAASIWMLCNIFLCSKVHKLFAKNTRRKYIKFKLIRRHLSIFWLSKYLKCRFQPRQQGFFLFWPYAVKGLPMSSLHCKMENYPVSHHKGLNQAGFLAQREDMDIITKFSCCHFKLLKEFPYTLILAEWFD